MPLHELDPNRPVHHTDHRIKHAKRPEMDAILDKYRRSSLVVTSCLHACIIGIAMGKRVLAVSGDKKIDAFMHAVGLEDWLLDREHVAEAQHRLAEIQAQTVPRDRITQLTQGNRDTARRVADMLAEP